MPLPTRWADAPERNAYNEAIYPLARRRGIEVLPIWEPAAAQPGEHVAPPRDCTHWILPGVIGNWNEMLFALLLERSTSGRLVPPPPRSTLLGGLPKRWAALRHAFVQMPGCAFHLTKPAREISPVKVASGRHEVHGSVAPSRASPGGAATKMLEERGCCSSTCRSLTLLPHLPGGTKQKQMQHAHHAHHA